MELLALPQTTTISSFTVKLNNSGTNSNITITVSSNYSDATSRATLASAPKSWNITDLGNTASVAPTFTRTTIASNNTTIAVTFNEAVFNTMVEVVHWKLVTLLYPSRVEWQQLMLHHLVYRFLEMYIP